MKPIIPITNPAFRYVPSGKTDVRKTWAKARKEMKEQKPLNIVQLRKAK